MEARQLPSVTARHDGIAIRKPWQWSRRQQRRAFQWGCLPVTLLVAVCGLVFLNIVTYRRAPSWISDPSEFLFSGHMMVSLGMLTAMQLMATWLMGLLSAASAGTLAAKPRSSIRRRLAVVRRRVRIATWAVLMLRLGLLLGLAIAWLFMMTVFDGSLLPNFVVDLFRVLRMGRGLFVVPAAGLMLISFFVGPFLRMRYSLAIGVWAATFTPHHDERPWVAASARLGAGLLGVLGILWGVSAITLFGLAVVDLHSSYHLDSTAYLHLLRLQDTFVTRWATISLAATVFLAAYLTGQVLLPPVYLWLAQRRLDRMPIAGNGSDAWVFDSAASAGEEDSQ